jgi:ABC-2 type transport system permease protein
MTAEPTALPPLREPWRTGGLLGVLRHPAVLWEAALADRRRDYDGTVLGWVWAFIKPLTRLMVYVLVIGVLLGLSRRVDNFAIYIFDGLVCVLFFTTALTKGTKTLAKNGGTVRRLGRPLELYPTASVLSSLLQMREPFIVMVVAAVVEGWTPDVPRLLMAAAAVFMLTTYLVGLAMIVGVGYVYVKDTLQVVGIITMLASWASPLIYPWTLISERFGEDSLITTIYLSNPVTVTVFAVRSAFWERTVSDPLPPIPATPVIVAIVVSLLTLLLGQLVLHRTRHRVIQRARWT